jgi:hypothetical protein
MDPSILEIIRGAVLLPTFDFTTGWYSSETLNALRVQALKVLPERINSFLALPDSVVWEQFHARSGGDTGDADVSAPPSADAGGVYTSNLTGPFELNEGEAEFGFDQRSTGMFVDFNRTMNTLRAYLHHAPHGVAAAASASCSSNAPTSSGASNLTPQGAAALDPLRTVDGVYCGKCVAWLRPYYAAVRQAMAQSGLEATSFSLEQYTPIPIFQPAARSAAKPAKQFVAKQPPARPKAATIAAASALGQGVASTRQSTSVPPGGRQAQQPPSTMTSTGRFPHEGAAAFELLEDEASGSSQGGGTSDSEDEGDYYV